MLNSYRDGLIFNDAKTGAGCWCNPITRLLIMRTFSFKKADPGCEFFTRFTPVQSLSAVTCSSDVIVRPIPVWRPTIVASLLRDSTINSHRAVLAVVYRRDR